VDDQQRPDVRAVEDDRGGGDVEGPARVGKRPARHPRGRRRVRTAHLGGEQLRPVEQCAGGIAVAEGEEALVLDHPGEEGVDVLKADAVPRPIGEELNERLLDGGRDEARPDVKVAEEPAERQLVHKRHDGVRDGGQRQRHEETQ